MLKGEIYMDSINSLQKEIEGLKNENKRLRSDEKSVRVSNAEQANYQESQIRFRTVFETSRLGNKIIGPDLKILQLNDAMVALLGYEKKEEILGTDILDYAPSDFHIDWAILQSKLWGLHTPSFTLETCLKRKDGSIIWCNVTSILFQDKGKTLGYTIIEDITERHNLLKHKDDFIGVASHELKTPLTSLQAVLEFMNSIIETETVISDKLINLSKRAETYVLRLSDLVEDLLSSTRIEKDKLSLNITRFTFFDLVDKCCKHIRLVRQCDIVYHGDLATEIEADENKLEQVIVNLVNNAVKHAPESKEITMKVEKFNNMTKISVIDKGNGIQADKLPLLFNAYYQVNKKVNQGSGMGLGLYISSEIIKKHGGEMGVMSKVGEGSTFWFTIPKIVKHHITSY